MYPRVGLSPFKTASLKDAKMALATAADRGPFMQAGLDISRTGWNGLEGPLLVNPEKVSSRRMTLNPCQGVGLNTQAEVGLGCFERRAVVSRVLCGDSSVEKLVG